MSIIDISLPLSDRTPTWPGGPGFSLVQYTCIRNGDLFNNSRLACDVHVGTHLDAPSHAIGNGSTIDQIPLDMLLGPAVVVHLPDVAAVSADDLEQLSLPAGVKRLLLRTRNSEQWKEMSSAFRTDFVALTADAARWVVDHGIGLIGVDYLSAQRYGDSPETHTVLLGAEVVIVEGLNLALAAPGEYELLCLPLLLVGAEGAPARAVLRTLPKKGPGRRDFKG